MSRTDPKPVDVLVDGEWVPGWLTSWERRAGGEWWGNVTYTRDVPLSSLDSLFTGPAASTALLTWDQVRPAAEIRPRVDDRLDEAGGR